MSSYIQVNIYNQTLDTLNMRGINLQTILGNIYCGDCYISEIPINPPKKPRQPPAVKEEIPEPSTENAPSSSSSIPLKPFKSISAEICTGPEISLNEVLKLGDNVKTSAIQSFNGSLFDDWDPLMNLGETAPAPVPVAEESPEDPAAPSSSAPRTLFEALESTVASSDAGLKTPKLEIPEEEPTDVKVEMNDSEQANWQEMQIIQDLLKQRSSTVPTNFASAGEGSLKSVQIKMESVSKSRRKLISEDPEISNTIYTIICSYPGCSHQYNWRVKYGKLRLLDHALTHSNRRIPCKLCGFEATNVRRMRSHYAKDHPAERVQGYGMKALVSDEQENEEELRDLWQKCYAHYTGLIGEASGFSENDKFRRKKRKIQQVEPVDRFSRINDTLEQSVDQSIDQSTDQTMDQSMDQAEDVVDAEMTLGSLVNSSC